MDERRADIDLAFRNGLKDYEVLPPTDLWAGIDSRLVRKEKPFYLIRAAAFLAVAMTLSVLAYRFASKTPVFINKDLSAFNEESSVPPVGAIKKSPFIKKNSPVILSGIRMKSLAENIKQVQRENPGKLIVSGKVELGFPVTGLRRSGKNTELNIVKHYTAKKDFDPPTPALLPVSAVNKLYQDYLSAPVAAQASPALKQRWSISTLASPTYYGKISSGSDQLSKQISESEKAVVTYSGGVAVAYKLGKRLSVQSGLFYSTLGQEVDGISSYAGFQKYNTTKGTNDFVLLTSNGKVTTSSPDIFLSADMNSARLITNYGKDIFDPQKASLDYLNNTMKQTFSYLEMPVFLRYKVIDRSIDLSLIGGMSYNLLVNNSVYTVIDGSKYMIGTTEGLNMFAISSSVGMGMEYNFSGKLSFNLEPTFRYYINTFNNSATSAFHPYAFGVFSGLTYKF